MSEWKPITAASPADGFFLVYEDGVMRTMLRENGKWVSPGVPVKVTEWGDRVVIEGAVISDCIYEPTHWMSLPDAPMVCTQGNKKGLPGDR